MKSIHILASALILGVSGIIGVVVHGHLTRFTPVSSNKDGFVYVIDRASGEGFVILGGERSPITDYEPRE